MNNATVDMSSPFMQQMLKNNPNLLAQLGLTPATPVAQAAQIITPAMQAKAITEDMVRQIVDERLKEMTPMAAPAAMQQLQNVAAQFETVFQKALPESDYKAFHEYVASGSPGFSEMLASEKLYPIAQLLWETIKENQK